MITTRGVKVVKTQDAKSRKEEHDGKCGVVQDTEAAVIEAERQIKNRGIVETWSRRDRAG